MQSVPGQRPPQRTRLWVSRGRVRPDMKYIAPATTQPIRKRLGRGRTQKQARRRVKARVQNLREVPRPHRTADRGQEGDPH